MTRYLVLTEDLFEIADDPGAAVDALNRCQAAGKWAHVMTLQEGELVGTAHLNERQTVLLKKAEIADLVAKNQRLIDILRGIRDYGETHGDIDLSAPESEVIRTMQTKITWLQNAARFALEPSPIPKREGTG